SLLDGGAGRGTWTPDGLLQGPADLLRESYASEIVTDGSMPGRMTVVLDAAPSAFTVDFGKGFGAEIRGQSGGPCSASLAEPSGKRTAALPVCDGPLTLGLRLHTGGGILSWGLELVVFGADGKPLVVLAPGVLGFDLDDFTHFGLEGAVRLRSIEVVQNPWL